MSRFVAGLRSWFRPGRLDADVSEELRLHVEWQIEADIESGMTPEEARRHAHLVTGNLQAIREESRAARPGALVHQIGRDLMFGMRLLQRSPGLAITSVLVVALGIGTTTTVFSVAYGMLLRPPPYAQPDRLVALWTRLPDSPRRVRVNPADRRDWRDHNRVLEDIALVADTQNFNLLGAGEPERLLAARVSSNLFPVLRVAPALGRTFTEDEDEIGRDRVVLLSDGLWRRRFGGDPSIVGRNINLTGVSYRVVGVMRPEFQYPSRGHQLWVPLTINPRQLARQVPGYDHLAIARLRPGVDLEQAQREMHVIARRLEQDFPATNRDVGVEVLPMLEETTRVARPMLQLLLVAVLCLLLIASLNLAGLLGARAASRTREFSVRLALGASRGRLTVQALAEVVPVLLIGGIAGVAAARTAIAAFVQMAPPTVPLVEAIRVSGAVLAFAIIILVVTGLVAGLLPALHAWRAHVPATAHHRTVTPGRSDARTRSLLVVGQFALTLPLLVGGTTLVRSFSTLMQVDPGFQPDQVVTMHLAISRSTYTDDRQVAAYSTRVVERVATIPGVESAAMVNRLPLSGNNQVLAFEFEGMNGPPLSLQSRSVTPDYFRTMRIAIREGRAFTELDGASSPLVGVIDTRAATALWPGQSAIGKRYRVSLPGQKTSWGQIVGVVDTVHHSGLEFDDDRQMYFSHHQFTDGRMALVVRSRDDVRALAPSVIQAVQSVDRDQPVYDVRTMNEVVGRSVTPRWLIMAMLGFFAMSSLLLATVGLYGVVAYTVAQRAREFGVRLALGAARSDVLRLVVARGSRLAAIGAVIGLGATVLLAVGMERMLYGVAPLDPVSFAASGAGLFGVALLASYLPARRASLTDPARTLRADV